MSMTAAVFLTLGKHRPIPLMIIFVIDVKIAPANPAASLSCVNTRTEVSHGTWSTDAHYVVSSSPNRSIATNELTSVLLRAPLWQDSWCSRVQ